MFKILYSLFAANQTFVLIIILVLAFIYLTYQFSKKYRVILNFRKFSYDSPTLKLNTTPISGLSDTSIKTTQSTPTTSQTILTKTGLTTTTTNTNGLITTPLYKIPTIKITTTASSPKKNKK